MKARWVAAVVLAGLMGGCAAGDSPANPNLLAPKAILAARADGNATLFVHSAFGDHQYDWIAVSIDNATIENRTSVYSFEADVPAPHFFLEVTAGSAQQQFHMRARIDITAASDRTVVTMVDEKGSWVDPHGYALPWEHIMDKKVPA